MSEDRKVDVLLVLAGYVSGENDSHNKELLCIAIDNITELMRAANVAERALVNCVPIGPGYPLEALPRLRAAIAACLPEKQP